MKEAKTITDSVDALLEEPVVVTINVDNITWKHKFRLAPRKKVFTLKPLVCGTILRISKVIESMSVDMDKIDQQILMDIGIDQVLKNLDKLIEVIAIAIENSEKPPTKATKRFLMENSKPQDVLALIQIIMKQMDVMGFMTSIILVKGMSLFKKEEIIASGEPLEV